MSAPVGDPPIHICVRAMGIDIDLVVTGQQLARAVTRAWQDALSDTAVPPTHRLTVALGSDTSADVRGDSLEEVLHRLSPAVTQVAIGHGAGDLVMLHAAALADPLSGATAVLVAGSGTGKTTAAGHLGQSLAYLSDETSAITRDFVVLPHRKPLSIIRGGTFKAQVAPVELSLLTTERECRLSQILLIERDPDHAGEPVMTGLDNIDAIAMLAPQASFLGKLDRPLHRLAGALDHVGGARHITYRESATLAPLLRDLLAGARP